MRKLLVALALVVLLGVAAGVASCAPGPVKEQGVQYFYDEAHNVSIWAIQTRSGEAIAVLPGNQVKNPQRPAEIIRP